MQYNLHLVSVIVMYLITQIVQLDLKHNKRTFNCKIMDETLFNVEYLLAWGAVILRN